MTSKKNFYHKISTVIICLGLLTQAACEGENADSPTSDSIEQVVVPVEPAQDEVVDEVAELNVFGKMALEIFPEADSNQQQEIGELLEEMQAYQQDMAILMDPEVLEDQQRADDLAQELLGQSNHSFNDIENIEDLEVRLSRYRFRKLEYLMEKHIFNEVRDHINANIKEISAARKPIRDQVNTLKKQRKTCEDKACRKALSKEIKSLWVEVKAFNSKIRKHKRVSKKLKKEVKLVNKQLRKIKKKVKKINKKLDA